MNEILFSINGKYSNKKYSNEDFEKIILSFVRKKNLLSNIKIKDLIRIFNELSNIWQKKDSKLYNLFSKNNLGFLIGWLKQNNIQEILNLNLNDIEALDKPKLFDRKKIYAAPKGTIVHWIAGNVPLLGILSLFQGILSKNKNIVKVPSTFKKILSEILNDVTQKTFKIGKKKISGRKITDSILVVYVDKNNTYGQQILSKYADIRYAWGGREAIENIMRLNKKIDCEDIVMGPKISAGVISRNFLKNRKISETLADNITRDVFNFNQMGCNSPHNIYIEKNSKISVKEFAKILYEKFMIESKKRELIDRNPIDTYNILAERVFYSASKERDALFDDGYQFSIFIDYNNPKSSSPLYYRTVYLKIINNIYEASDYFPPDIQTIGTAISKSSEERFIKNLVNKGALRITKIGKMSVYETPWDGILSINRMVKWVPISY